MSTHRTSVASGLVLAACCVLFGACTGRTKLVQGTTPPTPTAITIPTTPPLTVPAETSTTVAVTEAPTTVALTTLPPTTVPVTDAPTTEAPTTVPAPTTTVPPPPDPLVLRSNGFGLFDFGTPDTTMVPSLPPELGGFSADTTSPSLAASGGVFEVEDAPGVTFAFPAVRVLCYHEICFYFGGPTAASLTFVGWSFTADAPGTPLFLGLKDAAGVSIGSKESDFPADIMATPGGPCPNRGLGTSGTGLVLTLDGTVFSTTDAAGNPQPQTPDPTTVTVTEMDAGQIYVDTNGLVCVTE